MLGYGKVLFQTSGTSGTLPEDFNPNSNIVALLAGGAASAVNVSSSPACWGGGGSAYAWKLNIELNPLATYTYAIGAGGASSGAAGTDSVFSGSLTPLIASAAVKGATILSFASVPSYIVQGMVAYDVTTPGAIISGQQVLSTTATTVTLSAGIDAAISSGDSLYFDFPTQGQLVTAKAGICRLHGQPSGGQASSCIGTGAYSGGEATQANGGTAKGGGAAGPNGPGNGQNADGNTISPPTASGTEFDSSHGCGVGGPLSGIYGSGGLYGAGGSSFASSSTGVLGYGTKGLLIIAYNPATPQAAMLLGL